MKFKLAAMVFTIGILPINSFAKAQNSEYYPEDAIGAPRIGAQYTQIGKLWPIDSSPAVPSKQKCNWSLPDGPEDTAMGCSYKDFKNIIYDVEGIKIIAIHVTPDAENVWYSKLPFGVRPNDNAATVSAKIKKGGQIPKASKVDEPSYYNYSLCFYPKKNNPKYACFSFNRGGTLEELEITDGLVRE